MNIESLRHRNSPAGKYSSSYNSNNDTKYNHMAYTRRSVATPFSRAGSSKILPNGSRSLTSYRKKFYIILVVTSLYTAFLYRRGQWMLWRVFSMSICSEHHSYRCCVVSRLSSLTVVFVLSTLFNVLPLKNSDNTSNQSFCGYPFAWYRVLSTYSLECFPFIISHLRRSQYLFRTYFSQPHERDDSGRS